MRVNRVFVSLLSPSALLGRRSVRCELNQLNQTKIAVMRRCLPRAMLKPARHALGLSLIQEPFPDLYI